MKPAESWSLIAFEVAAVRQSGDYLDAVAEELNDRPRKTLGFMKPSEKIIELLDAA